MLRIVQFIAFIVVVLLLRQWGKLELPPVETGQPKPPPTVSQAEQSQARVQRVVDGDTLLLEGGERVRLLGVDTPETKKPNTPVQPFGPEASAFTTQMVEGKIVTLVFDRERYDRYRRTLAFVFVEGRCLNEELIRNGFSRAILQYPFRNDMKKRFTEAEREARSLRLGIWSIEGTASPAPVPQREPYTPQPTERVPPEAERPLQLQ